MLQNTEGQINVIQKSVTPEGKLIVEGYILIHSKVDRDFDVVTKEGAQKALASLLGPPPKSVLWNHNIDKVIGKVLDATLDDRGIKVTIEIDPQEKEIINKVLNGYINSFSYYARAKKVDEQWDEEIGGFKRIYNDIDIYEVSLVSVPAQPEALVLNAYLRKMWEVSKLREDDKILEEHEGKPITAETTTETKTTEVQKSETTTPETTSEATAESATESTAESTTNDKAAFWGELMKSGWKDIVSNLIEFLKALEDKLEGDLKEEVAGWIKLLGEAIEAYGYPYPYPEAEKSEETEGAASETNMEKGEASESGGESTPAVEEMSAAETQESEVKKAVDKDEKKEMKEDANKLEELQKTITALQNQIEELESKVNDIPIRKGLQSNEDSNTNIIDQVMKALDKMEHPREKLRAWLEFQNALKEGEKNE